MGSLSIYLPPFAADYSGVCSALFDYNCLIVIYDPACCTKNYVDYDEPRWAGKKKSTFCAQLRMIDAILGNEETLISQTIMMAKILNPQFIAILGSPVPAIIGTDLGGIAKEIESRSGYPAIGFHTTGFEPYYKGVSSALLTLLKKFALPDPEKAPGSVNILGMTPLDFSMNDNGVSLQRLLMEYGLIVNGNFFMGTNLEQIRLAQAAEANLVVSVSGLEGARLMAKEYGIPYVVAFPVGKDYTQEVVRAIKQTILDGENRVLNGKALARESRTVLIIGEQVLANSIRAALYQKDGSAVVTVASFFAMDKEISHPGDIFLDSERQLIQLIREGRFTRIIADPLICGMPDLQGMNYFPLPHPAISSNLYWDQVPLFIGNEMEVLLNLWSNK